MTVEVCERELSGIGRDDDPWICMCIPTASAGPERWEGRVRLRNQIDATHELLIEKGMPSRPAWELLQPAADLLDDISFWKSQTEGLAVLITGGRLRVMHLQATPPETALVDTRRSMIERLSALSPLP